MGGHGHWGSSSAACWDLVGEAKQGDGSDLRRRPCLCRVALDSIAMQKPTRNGWSPHRCDADGVPNNHPRERADALDKP